MTAITKQKSPRELVEAWTIANEIMDSAYAELDRAKLILEDVFGREAYLAVYPRDSRGVEGVRKDNKKAAWRHIIALLGIRKVMSLKRIDMLDKDLDRGDMPNLTLETIEQIANGLLYSAHNYATEAVQEVFDFLRPGARVSNTHATNEEHARFSLGSKVILTNCLEYCWGNGYPHTYYRVSHWRTDNLRAVDRIFHLADGAGELKGYNGPLVDAILTTPTRSDGRGETNYFAFRCHKNGNLHLQFKRPDLVAKINAMAGDASQLPTDDRKAKNRKGSYDRLHATPISI